MSKINSKKKMVILMFIDSLSIILAALLAYWLLENYVMLPNRYYYVMIGITVLIYGALGVFRHLFANLPYFTGLHDLIFHVKMLSFAFLLSAVVSSVVFQLVSYRYIFLTYMFSLVFIPGIRIVWRVYHEYTEKVDYRGKEDPSGKIRTLLVGAGEGGRLFISSLIHRPNNIEIIGIVDRDEKKQQYRLMGIPVLGNEADIPDIVTKYGINQVTITIPSMKPQELERILDYCNQVGVAVNQMPRMEDVMTGKLSVSRTREIDVVDLLGRKEVKLD